MTTCTDDYDAFYRWEWFRREDWRGSFRDRKRNSSVAFAELVKERGMAAAPVLDCSCGLGLKTIVMREAGLAVQGSDQCPPAIEYARLLAKEEGHSDIDYFVSSWADLPGNTEVRYAAIFNDALSWARSNEEMASSLRGFRDCLAPGGVLTYMGALPGTGTEGRAELLEREWERRTAEGSHGLGMRASRGGTSVQEVVCFDKGSDFIDEHHLYIVDEDGARRLERWCIRITLKWSWPRLEQALTGAGFVSFSTKEFIAANGKPFHLVVAQRD